MDREETRRLRQRLKRRVGVAREERLRREEEAEIVVVVVVVAWRRRLAVT